MPWRVLKLKGKDKYRVLSPSGVKAKATTKANAEKQVRLLRALDHGMKAMKK